MCLTSCSRSRGRDTEPVVAANELSEEVLGFYAVSVAELVNDDLPAHFRKRLRRVTRYPQQTVDSGAAQLPGARPFLRVYLPGNHITY